MQADARGEPISAAAVSLLLRRYVSTGREDLRRPLERGLTAALDVVEAGLKGPRHEQAQAGLKGPRHEQAQAGLKGPRHEPHRLADHLVVLAEAAALTDDDRIAPAVAAGAAALLRAWPSRGAVVEAMADVAACLTAAAALPAETAGTFARPAVDELERVLGRVYRPGEPLARSMANPDEPDGGIAEHVGAATALLAAHSLTGRLPYAMLAEELMQPVFAWSGGGFAVRAAAARVLCRIAVLHDDPDYRHAAVVKELDYRDRARQIVDALAPEARELGVAAAVYGLALDELLALRRGGS